MATELKKLVGAGRFELPTPCSRSKCATRLRYAPPDRLRWRVHGVTCPCSATLCCRICRWSSKVCASRLPVCPVSGPPFEAFHTIKPAAAPAQGRPARARRPYSVGTGRPQPVSHRCRILPLGPQNAAFGALYNSLVRPNAFGIAGWLRLHYGAPRFAGN